ncbi:hypothetical protein CDL15_Pgr000717 [Punica granatum]|uniref:Uncharacterized protein n=2 Tax=Punica granatum TaxID=22663 RepID=A0A218W3B6_PUNGR|nr:hypothetical protein CDL15_Pgr000717 [Punica granatum]
MRGISSRNDCSAVEPGCMNSTLVQRQSDFYAGFGVDLIEENVQNEMSCVQVLRILIAKADAEIDELEKCLVSLQCELAGEEHEEWYDVCCDTLKEKIDFVNKSLRSLRSNAGDCASDPLSMHREPAEKTHEILKRLLTNYLRKNHEKAVETAAGNSSMDVQDTLSLDSNRKQEKIDSDSKNESDEFLQQPTDVIDEVNTLNTLKRRSRHESSALGEESYRLSLTKEGKREDQRTGIVQLHDVTVNGKSKLGLEPRHRKKRKELSGPSAERSQSPHEEIPSAVSKAEVPRKFSIGNSRFNEPSREKTVKKMVVALTALPPNNSGQVLRPSKVRRDAPVSLNSLHSREKEAESMLEEDLLITELNESLDSPRELEPLPASDAVDILQDMKLDDLRAIAKEKKLKGYHKLPKKVLVEKIVNSLGSC